MGLKKKKWFQSIVKFMPMVATAMGGPLAGAATNVLKDALGLPVDATEDQIEAAIVNATPADFIRMKEGEQKFLAIMRDLDIKEDELVYKDIQSAREMKIQTKDWVPAALTAIALAFFFSLSFIILNKLEIVQENDKFIFYLLGASTTWVTQGFNFFLGSSKGSQRKTDLLAANGGDK